MRLLATLLVMLPCVAFAYPIPPQNVWNLVKMSELIVDATVEDVKVVSPEHDKSFTVAVLRVEETWKGEAMKSVEVVLEPNMMCLVTARYEKGERVVAFLGGDKQGQWHTVAFSYGVRRPAGAVERDDMKRAIREAETLQREGGESADQRWALNAYASPSLRWDALLQLQPPETGQGRSPEFRDSETPYASEVLEELERLFIARPSFDENVMHTLRLLSDRPSKALDAVVAEVIETVLMYEVSPSWVEGSIWLLARRHRVVLPFGAVESRASDADQRMWRRFKKRVGLKPKLRIDYSRPR